MMSSVFTAETHHGIELCVGFLTVWDIEALQGEQGKLSFQDALVNSDTDGVNLDSLELDDF